MLFRSFLPFCYRLLRRLVALNSLEEHIPRVSTGIRGRGFLSFLSTAKSPPYAGGQ